MKKSMIAAGAASVALAAMPIVGVFAEGVTDTIKVGIDETCAIAYDATTAHVNGDSNNGAWGSEATANVLTGTLANGGVATNYGSSNFRVTCNHATGYAVTATATDLTNGKSGDALASIPLNSSFAAGVSGWAYKVTAKENSMTTNATEWYGSDSTKTNASFITGEAPVSNGAFTVQYGVGLSATQQADNYTGTITYTIAPAA